MKIIDDTIDIHYHYDIKKYIADDGNVFVPKVNRNNFSDLTDNEFNTEFPVKYSSFDFAYILIESHPDDNSPKKFFAPYFSEKRQLDITDINEWEEVSEDEMNRRLSVYRNI